MPLTNSYQQKSRSGSRTERCQGDELKLPLAAKEMAAPQPLFHPVMNSCSQQCLERQTEGSIQGCSTAQLLQIQVSSLPPRQIQLKAEIFQTCRELNRQQCLVCLTAKILSKPQYEHILPFLIFLIFYIYSFIFYSSY